jgi:pimeloyl-ACP methyl ester carboxylesterase
VVVIDLAGHGESGLDRAAWTMPSFGDDVAAVADQLGLAEMVLIGQSMGGDVVVEAALRLPGRVTGLVWIDVYGSLGDPDSDGAIEDFVAPFRADFVATTRAFVRRTFLPSSPPDVVEWVVADMSAAPPEVAVDAIRYAVGNEAAVIAGLAKLGLPVVAIDADRGRTDVESLARHGVRATIMSGVGHFPMLEDPDGFNRRLAEVIDEMTRPAG